MNQPPLDGMPPDPDALSRRTGLRADERHLLGDHRSCPPESCQWAARWRWRVLQAGTAALDATGRTLAVLCLRCPHAPHLLATVDTAWTAKGLRNSHARARHGNLYETLPTGQAFKSVVLVVERDGDGDHLA